MEKLIPVINKLQDVFNAVGSEGIDLPQIVVIGSQSSGKSSVLENIVGRDFLPRGSGIVTRRPLVLQLINLAIDGNSKDSTMEEWGEFLHKPNEAFYDFAEIKKEIERETDRETGSNKGISRKPINLKVYSPHVLNLSLVDLPGITRVPVGDQPTDIEKQIKDMALSFISKKNAIIVAVTAANTDLANSDALQLAKSVDPEGLRTIGVITKVDLMDKGTNAMDVLTGRVIPLKLGFVGVVNRSQQDIIEGKEIRLSLTAEKSFFLNHPQYRKIAQRCGTQYLAQSLSKLLLHHIHESLPELRTKMSTLLLDAQKEMLSYGDPMLDESNNKGAILLQIITKFSTDYSFAIDGKLTDANSKELYGGARINYIFNEIFGHHLLKMSPLDGLTLNDIRTAIRNATGPRTALFVPEMSFELLTKRQISRLHEPSLQCVDAVFEELQRIVSQLESKELLRYNVLREKVIEVMSELLHECRAPTKAMISNLINIELAFINTAHPDFVGANGVFTNIVEQATDEKMAQKKKEEERIAMEQKKAQQPSAQISYGGQQATIQSKGLPNPIQTKSAERPARTSETPQKPPRGVAKLQPVSDSEQFNGKSFDSYVVPILIKPVGPLSSKESFETDLITKLLESYFTIVRKNIQDTIPKAIMHFLVTKSKLLVHNRLVQRLYIAEQFDDLLAESAEIASRRKATREMVNMLKRAQEILNEVRDYALK